jgi:uncharacterized membrane protein YphA (DoxX/SURF4 family)
MHTEVVMEAGTNTLDAGVAAAALGGARVKAKKVGYWVSTVLVALMLLPAGVGQVTLQNTEGFVRLGYPVYFMVLLGVWKLLGGVVLLVPRLPRVKEWAYAGVFIDFSSAAISDAVRGGSVGHVIAPIVCATILFASWALRPASRTLGTLFPARA